MMAVLTYRDLVAWQKGMDFVEAVYRVSRQFPADERFGLTNQLRRASVSIPSNIAEGQGRGVGLESAHHLRISQGSVQEAETQIMIADRLQFAPTNDLDILLRSAEEVGRLTRGLHQSILPE
jgi:four helix bundle protein